MKYIVYITLYRGTKLPPWYIGSTTQENIDLGYNGSVNSKEYRELYKTEQRENKHLFRTKILSYHKTREEAYSEELRLHKMHLVVENDKYFNKSYAQEYGFSGGDTSEFIDYKSESYKKNHHDALIKRYDIQDGVYTDYEVRCHKCGKNFTVNERAKKFPRKERYFCTRSCANSKVHSNETRAKLSAKAKLQINRAPMPTSKGTKYMHFNQKNKRVKLNEVPYFIEQGWEFGMIRINK